MAIVKPEKVRPVMNMSATPDRSANDAIAETALPKLKMSTVKDFSLSLLSAGSLT